MYPVTRLSDDENVHSVDDGTNLLISGPAHTGTSELFLSLIAEGVDSSEGVIIITTDKSAKKLLTTLSALTDTDSLTNVVVIDARAGGPPATVNDAVVYTVGSPTDLTGIGIRIATAMQHFERQGITSIRLGLNSISTLSQFHSANIVFKFLHVLCGRIDATNALGLGLLNRTPADDNAIDLVSSAYDVHVEYRERDDVTESWVIGLSPTLRTWSPI